MKKYINNIISIVINALIIIFTTISILSFFIVGGDGNMAVFGTRCFRFFTMDSNIFLCLTSIAVVVFEICIILKKQKIMPKWAIITRFASVVSTTVTFIVVIAFLGPTMGYGKMFEGVNLFLHLLNPIFGIVSFCFTEENEVFEKKLTFYGLSSVIVYGLVYICTVLIFKVWEDFYGFNSGILEGLWFITIIVMLLATLGISYGIYYLRKVRK